MSSDFPEWAKPVEMPDGFLAAPIGLTEEIKAGDFLLHKFEAAGIVRLPSGSNLKAMGFKSGGVTVMYYLSNRALINSRDDTPKCNLWVYRQAGDGYKRNLSNKNFSTPLPLP